MSIGAKSGYCGFGRYATLPPEMTGAVSSCGVVSSITVTTQATEIKPFMWPRACLADAPSTREPLYAPCLEAPPVSMGPMTGWTFRHNPRRLAMMMARYKFAAKMLEGARRVAEIGCGDAFGSAVVRQAVDWLDLYDFDGAWADAARETDRTFKVHDIVADGPLGKVCYDGIYMIDVLEHIAPADEPKAMANILASLTDTGVFIAGCPSLESQVHTTAEIRASHVNCRSGDDFRKAMTAYFENVFLFGMNDEVLHTGFAPMCHYLFVLCAGPRYRRVPRPGAG